jgi:predicted RNase H-like HicB family nuclease
MAHYIALIHKDADSCYGVSFPDLPGVVTALRNAAEVIEFAAEDWPSPFPAPRTIDELRADARFQQDAHDAVIASVPFGGKDEAAQVAHAAGRQNQR